MSCGPKISKRSFKIRYLWLKKGSPWFLNNLDLKFCCFDLSYVPVFNVSWEPSVAGTKITVSKSPFLNQLSRNKLDWNLIEWSIPKANGITSRHLEGCCDTVASLETWFRAAIFRVLLHEACVFSIFFYLRSTDEVIDETSFEVFTVVCWK